MIRTVAVLTLFACLVPVTVLAQSRVSDSQPLTNDGVIALVKAGLSEAVVVNAIQTAKTPRFDVSPHALIDLARAGVPNVVVEEMQRAALSHQTVAPAAPLPHTELELASKTAHIISNSTDQKVFDGIGKRLREWRRWELVDDRQHADVLLVFADKVTQYGPVGSFTNGSGTLVPIYSDQRFLTMVDPHTNENVLTISCERRLTADYTAGVLVNRLRDRIQKDEHKHPAAR